MFHSKRVPFFGIPVFMIIFLFRSLRKIRLIYERIEEAILQRMQKKPGKFWPVGQPFMTADGKDQKSRQYQHATVA